MSAPSRVRKFPYGDQIANRAHRVYLRRDLCTPLPLCDSRDQFHVITHDYPPGPSTLLNRTNHMPNKSL